MKNLRKLRDFLGERVCWFILASVLVGVFLFLIETSFVFVFQGFLRAIKLVEPDKLLLPKWYPESLLSAVLLLVLFGILRSLANLLKMYLGGMVNQAFLRIQRERILRFALENAEQLNSHEVINIYTERVVQSAQIVNLGAQLALTCTTASLLLVLGLRLAPIEMASCMVMLGIFLLPMRLLNEKIQHAGEGITEESQIANRSLMQGLRHYFFLKIYGLIPQEVEHGLRSVRTYEEHYRRYFLTYSFKNSFPLAAGIFVISFTTYLSVQYLHSPSVKLISFFYIFMRLAQTASESSGTFTEFRLQLPGLKRLYYWYERTMLAEREVKLVDPKKAEVEAAFAKNVELNGIVVSANQLSFFYEKAKPVLKDFSLKANRGDVLVIQGESGAGKSTVLSLILGLHKPQSGNVLVNGFPVEDIRDVLGNYVAYVGPEPYLISGTVRDNLLYGHAFGKNVSDAQIWDALKKAQLRTEVEALPHGLQEVLHEHTQLSTGQKQRLAIARAMLRNPKLLILDEASANLDGGTERNFIESIRAILPGLTTIIISHKSSFNEIANQRIELKKIV